MPKPANEVSSPPLFASPQKRNLVICLLLVVATLALYNPVSQHPFVNYDDDRYVTDNPHIHAGLTWGTVIWAFTSREQANWHPLTWLSHALDYELFHLNPAGHHFGSLLLHAFSAVLLFLLLVRATGAVGPALFVAALFALHPLNVESVAWIAERKNVLSTFFFFLTLGAYGWYALKTGWRYLLVVIMFACGLMSKPMVITLPCLLLLLDYWPLARLKGCDPVALRVPQYSISRLLLEKIPLFALSAASALITMKAQQSGGAMRSTLQFPLSVRLENAIVAYAMYLWKMLWPARLAPLYPHPGDSLHAWQVLLSAIVLIAITALAIKFRSRRYLPVGWLWFLGTLIPVIGLVQVGDQAMADRYAYIPLIGIFVMIAWAATDLANMLKLSLSTRVIPAVCVLIALAFVTRLQLGYWSSNYDLWSHSLAVTENNFIAQDNLGGALVLLDRTDEAYPHFQAAAQINPNDPLSHSNLGAYLQEHGRLADAVEQYQITIRLTSDPGLLASTKANLGTAYRELGQDAKARESYDEALRLNPNQFNAYLGLGHLLERQGRLDEAITNYSRAVDLRPSAHGYVLLGHALQTANHPTDALSAYQNALNIAPDSIEAQQAIDSLKK